MFRDFVRQLTKFPGSTAVAILTLGAALGLTVAVFAVTSGLFPRSLPFPGAHELVRIERVQLTGAGSRRAPTTEELLTWRSNQTTFRELAAWVPVAMTVSVSGHPADRFTGAYVTWNLFDLLPVRPALGRGFVAGDGEPTAPAVILLSDQVWAERFGRDPKVLGTSLNVFGEPAVVVGVMPAGFRFPYNQALWVPLRFGSERMKDLAGLPLQVCGSLKPGVEMERATAELDALAAGLPQKDARQPLPAHTTVSPYLESYLDAKARSAYRLVLVAALLIFFLASVNVANLLLARMLAAGQELALRSALGASRFRLAAPIMVQSLGLSACGAVVGVGLAEAVITVYRHWRAPRPGPFWETVQIGLPELGVVLGLALLSGLGAGLLPALRSAQVPSLQSVQSPLFDQSLRLGWASQSLVAAQVGISLVLVAGAGLLIQSWLRLSGVPLGFQPDQVLTAELSLYGEDFPDAAAWRRGFAALEQRFQSVPGVISAGWSSDLPQRYPGTLCSIAVEGLAEPSGPSARQAGCAVVSPGLFRALGIVPLQGRLLQESDSSQTPLVAVVTRSFATRFFPSQASPLGRRTRVESLWLTVVGVVPDVHLGGATDPPERVLLPLAQSPISTMALVVKGHGNPLALVSSVRQAAAEICPRQALTHVTSMDDLLAERLGTQSFSAAGAALLSTIASLLAATGLYGLVNFLTRRRRRDLGIRLALGARAGSLAGSVARHAVIPLGIGSLVGGVLYFFAAKVISSITETVAVASLLPVAFAALGLGAIALLACLGPVFWAIRLNPRESLLQP